MAETSWKQAQRNHLDSLSASNVKAKPLEAPPAPAAATSALARGCTSASHSSWLECQWNPWNPSDST